MDTIFSHLKILRIIPKNACFICKMQYYLCDPTLQLETDQANYRRSVLTGLLYDKWFDKSVFKLFIWKEGNLENIVAVFFIISSRMSLKICMGRVICLTQFQKFHQLTTKTKYCKMIFIELNSKEKLICWIEMCLKAKSKIKNIKIIIKCNYWWIV